MKTRILFSPGGNFREEGYIPKNVKITPMPKISMLTVCIFTVVWRQQKQFIICIEEATSDLKEAIQIAEINSNSSSGDQFMH